MIKKLPPDEDLSPPILDKKFYAKVNNLNLIFKNLY